MWHLILRNSPLRENVADDINCFTVDTSAVKGGGDVDETLIEKGRKRLVTQLTGGCRRRVANRITIMVTVICRTWLHMSQQLAFLGGAL